ncbi:hypothetical protein [Pediococcus acidilactici]|uniref:Uncharacterized protein n=1 Tax=Pediococcus acidilactici TaxID=1254 RepID=A0AAN5Y921_PEDAC|nr:hypothetical protein [Pediococcus acidilactici]KAF0342075.1 hypothetical protein GBO42_00630 [Pediococcus acidilactici]KAF0353930.1 hypothetical protein GBO46_00630 [Pediococcus acidilactici]KAF0357594.1 hypothetical protein GBO48_00630 [Pediococcus acidilactici]KAF0376452.1 hypothetical protein GBO57_00685 [Pediococcus acidilactici]KAF0377512.1 hypothetical protein GBO59_00630 [Pediococcus acidilactici]
MTERRFLAQEGTKFYPVTHKDAVVGLDVANANEDGLMSKADKTKLDKLQVEPIEGLKFKSPDGSIFVLSVGDDGKSVFTKEGG